MRVLVLGVNDIASAVGWLLWRHGQEVIFASEPAPTVTRRLMAFADAVFDGVSELEGVIAQRVETTAEAEALLSARAAIPLFVGRPLVELITALRPAVLVDARMRKRVQPERWLGFAPLTVGLGPGFIAGEHVDVAVETSWQELGLVRWVGANLPFAGEPREIGGLRRERYVYAPVAGRWRTERAIGELVTEGQPVAWIEAEDGEPLLVRAPATGAIRGLTRDGVFVEVGTKVLEIDPRGLAGQWRGLGERPRRVAEGVWAALVTWCSTRTVKRG